MQREAKRIEVNEEIIYSRNNIPAGCESQCSFPNLIVAEPAVASAVYK